MSRLLVSDEVTGPSVALFHPNDGPPEGVWSAPSDVPSVGLSGAVALGDGRCCRVRPRDRAPGHERQVLPPAG